MSDDTCQAKDHEVIEEPRTKFPVDFLCRRVGVNRSAYHKRRQCRGTVNRYEKNRIELTCLLQATHKSILLTAIIVWRPDVLSEIDETVSPNPVHKCCEAEGIRFEA